MAEDFGGTTTQPADFQVEYHGSIYLLRPLNDRAREWVNENIGTEETQMFGDAIVVEHRYIAGIVAAAFADGMVCE